MYRFQYHTAKDLKAALEAFKGAEDAVFLAGGQTLIPIFKQRLAAPSDVIDLSRITALKGIKKGEGFIEVGATACHAEVASAKEIQTSLPALAALAGHIGDPAVRNMGTLGGSIANNDPAADYPAAVLALGASVITHAREIAAKDFFTGLFETALDDGEVITAVRFPTPDRAAYAKFPNPVSRYALVGVFVADFRGDVRVAVTGAGPCVFRWQEAEAALTKNFSGDALENLSYPPDDLGEDIHASPAYRAHLISVMTRRALRKINK